LDGLLGGIYTLQSWLGFGKIGFIGTKVAPKAVNQFGPLVELNWEDIIFQKSLYWQQFRFNHLLVCLCP